MERSRRSLRRRATPLDCGSPARISHEQRSTVQKTSTRNLSEPRGVVGGRGVCLVCVCVCVRVLCVLRHAEKNLEKTRVWIQKTPPCVHSKRPRVSTQHLHLPLHLPLHLCAWCRYTRVRFECTHGGVFESTHDGRRQFCFPRKAHVESTRAPEVHQRKPWIKHIFSLTTDRQQHVSRFLQSFVLADKAVQFPLS